MNKTELIAKVANDAGLSHAQAGVFVSELLNTIQETLASGDSIALIGFGAFSLVERASRTGRNPKTGETITIPAARIPRFVPGKTLKYAVNPAKDVPKAPVAETAKTSIPSAKATTPTAKGKKAKNKK